MEFLLLKKFYRIVLLSTLIGASYFTSAQSCVCYQNHFLNDYKEADLIALVKVNSVNINYENADEDRVLFSTSRVFKGDEMSSLFIQQAVGSSLDNSGCRLYVKPGDELIIFAQLINGRLVTTPCKRNRFIYKNDPKFTIDNDNQLSILESLSKFNDQIELSSINCSSLEKDSDVLKEVGQLAINEEKNYYGLYNIQFTEDHKIKHIGVVSTFNKQIDKTIRIMLIKKKWEPCELNENKELLVGYFYNPATEYRKAYLSTF